MKRILRKLVPASVWESMSQKKRKLILAVAQQCLDRLPKGDQLLLKPRLELFEKMDYSKYEIFLYIDSPIEYKTRVHSVAKEPDTVNWIESTMKKGDVFFDIGANIGAYSLVALKFFRGNVKVFAFEPAFLNFFKLVRNLILNDCRDSVVPLQVALSDKTALESFFYQNLIPGGALHTLVNQINFNTKKSEFVFEQLLLCYRLDDLLDDFKLPAPNHLKIDVDGAQFSILKGAEKALDSGSIRSVLVEVEEGKEETEMLVKFLQAKGFKLDSRHRCVPESEDKLTSSEDYNFIFKQAR